MSPTPNSLQPTTLNKLAWRDLQQRFAAWQAGGLAGGPQCLVELLAANQPWIESGLDNVGKRFCLLVDLGQMLPGFQRAIAEMQELPESQDVFGIWIDSLALRLLKVEAAEEIVPIQIQNAPWHGFRRRFNQLERSERKRLLQTLPATSRTPIIPAQTLAPDSEWVQLWESVSSGVPTWAMPPEWHRFMPADDEEDFVCPNIILSRESERHSLEPLGRWLFRAAAVQEDNREDAGPFELLLPSWVIPKRPDMLLKELDGIADRLGGLPSDDKLQGIIKSLQHHYHPFESSVIATPTTREILAVARGWGGKDSHLEGLAGISSLRSGSPDEARMAYTRLLNKSTDRKDVALALANLAGLDLVTPEGIRNCEALLTEALKLNPWSTVARNGMALLQKRLLHQESEGSR